MSSVLLICILWSKIVLRIQLDSLKIGDAWVTECHVISNKDYCTILNDSSPLCDCDMPDEIFISSSC